MVKCYISKEYERLQNQFKNNCVKCKSSGLLDYETDILLAAVNVASNLIEEKNYLDALRVVNGLDTCGKLCKDSNKLKGCGCGRN